MKHPFADPETFVRSLRSALGDAPAARFLIECLRRFEKLPDGAADSRLDNKLSTPLPEACYGVFFKDCRDELAKRFVSETTKTGRPVMLDIGGGNGETQRLRTGFKYWLVDLYPNDPEADRLLTHDIETPLPLPDSCVDVVFSNQVLEHIRRPWALAKEMARVLKPGGLCLVSTVFAYRYHPFPRDYWRFTAPGLASIFLDTNCFRSVHEKYELTHRRDDRRGTAAEDKPPIDWLGGFRENWFVYFIGHRIERHAN